MTRHALRSSQVSGDQGWPAGMVGDADLNRFRGYAAHRDFYDGAQWSVRKRPGEVRLTVNYARTLLRKVASYVFPAPVSFAVTPGGDAAVANGAEQLLAEVVTANDLSRLDLELCGESSVLGDAAIKVTWDAERGGPVVAAVDPAALIGWTMPDNPRRLQRMAHRYGMAGREARELFGGSGTRWLDPDQLVSVVEEWTEERWRVLIDGQVGLDRENPYGWIPYVVATNSPRPHAFWGESDLTDLIDICTELNARMSVLSHVLQLSGAPIAVLENVDGSENITVGPGAKWELPKDSRAYLLDLLASQGIRLHIDYVELLYRALHDLSETPRTAFGDSGRTLSGAALEVEVQPLMQRVARKRRQWDAVYQERNARLLDLLERFGGHELGGLRQTTTIWPDVLPSDRESAVRNAVSLVEAGILSRHTAMASLGNVDPESEQERIVAERK